MAQIGPQADGPICESDRVFIKLDPDGYLTYTTPVGDPRDDHEICDGTRLMGEKLVLPVNPIRQLRVYTHIVYADLSKPVAGDPDIRLLLQRYVFYSFKKTNPERERPRRSLLLNHGRREAR